MKMKPAKMKALLILAENLKKWKLNFFRFALFHMKTRVSLNYFVSYCGTLMNNSLAWKFEYCRKSIYALLENWNWKQLNQLKKKEDT